MSLGKVWRTSLNKGTRHLRLNIRSTSRFYLMMNQGSLQLETLADCTKRRGKIFVLQNDKVVVKNLTVPSAVEQGSAYKLQDHNILPLNTHQLQTWPRLLSLMKRSNNIRQLVVVDPLNRLYRLDIRSTPGERKIATLIDTSTSA